LIYAGTTLRNPESEIGYSNTFSYRVSCSDYTNLLDRQIVVETFSNQYSREIIGRSVYEFAANDTETTLDLFESAWTESGVALPMTDDTSDRIEGTKSQQTGTSAAGTAIWTKTITSIDLTNYNDDIRIWKKIAEDQGVSELAFKFRVGTDSSNYYEWNSNFIGNDNHGCWHYLNGKFNNPTVTTGSPNITDITWLQLEIQCNAAMPSTSIHFDHMLATTGGFTLSNVIRGQKQFDDVRVQYKKPSVMIEELAKLQGYFWYVDNERDINFFTNSQTPAPFDITTNSENFSNLVISADITNLKNRQTVRGGIAPSEVIYIQQEVADGVMESWNLNYPPKDLTVEVDTGGGFVSQTVGVENLVDETTVDYVFNFSEKVVRRASATVLNSGDIIKISYYPYKNIRVRTKDTASIAAMKALTGGDGVYDGAVINDLGIRSWEEARDRANAEIAAYSNAVLTATFETEKDGLKAGQVIGIEDTDRGISEDFLIQKVQLSQKTDERFKYKVTCGSTMFGLIEFFQLLLKQTGKLIIDVAEIVDIVQNIDEVISIDELYSFISKSTTSKTGTRQVYKYDFIQLAGSRTTSGWLMNQPYKTQWQATFAGTETGTLEIDKASRYNDGSALKLTTSTGGTSNSLTASLTVRPSLKASTDFDLSADIEILSELAGGNGFTIRLKEYAAKTGGAALATTNIVSGISAIQDFTDHATTFTSNASTGYYDIEAIIDESTGSVSISDIIVSEIAADPLSDVAVTDFCETI
jgi:hypothetical protein